MFYDFELIATVSETNSLEARIIEKFNFKSEDNEKPSALIFHGTLGQNYQEADTPSWFNPHEIWQAVAYLRKFFDMGLKCDDVGIITPYLKQVILIRRTRSKLF